MLHEFRRECIRSIVSENGPRGRVDGQRVSHRGEALPACRMETCTKVHYTRNGITLFVCFMYST